MSPKGREQAEKILDVAAETRSVQQEIKLLRRQVEYQRLLLQSLWVLLKEKLGMQDADLLAKVQQIESQGQEPRAAEICTKCSRPLQQDSMACIYCGTESPRRRLF